MAKPSQQKRNTTIKQTILRDIYVDNLKIAGKASSKTNRAGRLGNKRQVILVVRALVAVCVVVALTFLVYQESPQAVLEGGQANQWPAAKDGMTYALSNTKIPFNPGIDPIAVYPADTIFPAAYLRTQVPVEQRPDNFNLLLSANKAVRLSTLFGLEVKTIVIDPGHGGKDPGAVGSNGTLEKDITLDVALQLKAHLDTLKNYKVLLTHEKDQTLSLAERVEFAKVNAADLFISIHVNSLPQASVNLIETYYFGAPLTMESLRLAERENKASHFSVGELETIIKDIGMTLKRQESANLAADIQKSLYRNMKEQDQAVVDSGIKMAPFVVLSQIEVPSVLVEISCLSNADEEAKLAVTSYREQVASYMAKGIVSYLEAQQLKIAQGEMHNE